MTSLIKLAFRHKNIINYTECKRFAGHNKWANIRHTKMEKDGQKATVIQTYIRKMRIAIAEEGTARPEANVKLARIIEQARKASLPVATIKNFLDKMQSSKVGSQSVVFESRGPSGCVVLIHLLSNNVAQSRIIINTHLRKTQFSCAESRSHGMYEEKGIILTEIDNRDIDKATEDAIEAGAEDAEQCKEDDKEFLQFTCAASELYKVRNKIEERNYKIIQAEVEYIPQVCVTLKDEEMELVSKLYDRLSNMEEVVKVYNNIS